MKPRTRLEFTATDDPLPAIERWAGENGFRAQPAIGAGKLYQKGIGFLVAPMMLSVERQGSQVVLETWVRCNLFVRATSFFILPAEMSVESGGFIGVVPRNMARNAINKLLSSLQQPLIP